MKILITGGAGYKGVILAEELLLRDHQVTILDNFMYGCDPVLHLLKYPKLDIKKLDIRNLTKKNTVGFHIIYHLAGISGYPACEANPHSAKVINVDATKLLCDLLDPDQVVIYASTTSFYGKSSDICNEDSPVNPVSLYGQTKYDGERIVMERDNSIALRFATIFGLSPKMRIDLLANDFTYHGVHDRSIVLFESSSKRTFVHLRDAIKGYIFVLENYERCKGQVINIGHKDMNYSKMEIAQAVKKHTHCEIIDTAMKDFDVRDFLISYNKIYEMGYRAEITLEQGIEELVRLYSFYKPTAAFRPI